MLQDGTGWPNLILRGLQTFLAFVNLCIYIALAVAQKSDGHIAGMTGWGLFFNVEVLLHAAAFCKQEYDGSWGAFRGETDSDCVALGSQWRLRWCMTASQSWAGSRASSARSGRV
jgi:hypothetical protein